MIISPGFRGDELVVAIGVPGDLGLGEGLAHIVVGAERQLEAVGLQDQVGGVDFCLESVGPVVVHPQGDTRCFHLLGVVFAVLPGKLQAQVIPSSGAGREKDVVSPGTVGGEGDRLLLDDAEARVAQFGDGLHRLGIEGHFITGDASCVRLDVGGFAGLVEGAVGEYEGLVMRLPRGFPGGVDLVVPQGHEAPGFAGLHGGAVAALFSQDPGWQGAFDADEAAVIRVARAEGLAVFTREGDVYAGQGLAGFERHGEDGRGLEVVLLKQADVGELDESLGDAGLAFHARHGGAFELDKERCGRRGAKHFVPVDPGQGALVQRLVEGVHVTENHSPREAVEGFGLELFAHLLIASAAVHIRLVGGGGREQFGAGEALGAHAYLGHIGGGELKIAFAGGELRIDEGRHGNIGRIGGENDIGFGACGEFQAVGGDHLRSDGDMVGLAQGKAAGSIEGAAIDGQLEVRRCGVDGDELGNGRRPGFVFLHLLGVHVLRDSQGTVEDEVHVAKCIEGAVRLEFVHDEGFDRAQLDLVAGGELGGAGLVEDDVGDVQRPALAWVERGRGLDYDGALAHGSRLQGDFRIGDLFGPRGIGDGVEAFEVSAGGHARFHVNALLGLFALEGHPRDHSRGVDGVVEFKEELRRARKVLIEPGGVLADDAEQLRADIAQGAGGNLRPGHVLHARAQHEVIAGGKARGLGQPVQAGARAGPFKAPLQGRLHHNGRIRLQAAHALGGDHRVCKGELNGGAGTKLRRIDLDLDTALADPGPAGP